LQLTLGATVWLVQQCEAGTRVPLLDESDSGTRRSAGGRNFSTYGLKPNTYARPRFCDTPGVPNSQNSAKLALFRNTREAARRC